MTKVFAAAYEHRHGCDIAVYATYELADAARTAIALEWYDHEFGASERPATDAETAADYWDRIEDETFYIRECDIIEA